jgi:hypothetical protein
VIKKVSTSTKKFVFWASVSVAVIGNFLYTQILDKKENEENDKTSS